MMRSFSGLRHRGRVPYVNALCAAAMLTTAPEARIPALTLHQPWASLLATGRKRIETRSWAPPGRLIGARFAIHAAQTSLPRDLSPDAIAAFEAALGLPKVRWPSHLPFGAVVCLGKLTGAYKVGAWMPGDDLILLCAAISGSEPMSSARLHVDEKHFGDYRPGRWLWVFEDVAKVEPPVPVKGCQRIWYW